MRKIVPLALASAIMTACTGTGDPGSSSSNDVTPSSSSQATQSSTAAISSSSAPTTPSSTATSSSAPSTGGNLYTDFVPNALEGAERYKAMIYAGLACSTCHGDDAKGTTPIDYKGLSAQEMFTIIKDEMPTQVGAPEECVGQCAADITAYLKSLNGGEPDVEVACDTTKPLGYSPRALRLLTLDEYQNSIEDLLGITTDYRSKIVIDSERGGFPNNSATPVDDSRAGKYWSVAESIANEAIENGQPFACTGGCSDKFVEELLPRLFRRPITEAERLQYFEIFGSSAPEEGLQLAIIAALTSPQFLYRSELGQQVSEILSTEPQSYYRPDPSSQMQVAIGNQGDDGFSRIQYYLDNNGAPRYTWTGNDIVSFQIRASQVNGSYPSIIMKTGNKEYPVEVTSDRPQNIRINIKDAAPGDGYIGFQTSSDQVYISTITFGAAVLYTPSRGDEDKMKLADPDSYVLDPFEYASVLSYTLTGSAPDDILWNAASNDGLHYEDQIRAQVERLIDTPRGRQRIGEMASYWFDTYKVTESLWDRDSALFPNYTPEVRESMAEEVRQLFREIVYQDRPFESFYGGDFTVLNKALSDYYGIASGSSGNNDWKVVDNLDKRGGVLTSGAFMTLHALPEKTRPIIRAVRVREQMLCQHILPPPLLVEDREELKNRVNSEFEQGGMTTREYNEGITDARSCDGCHKYQINPLFGMEDFDQAGQWRDTEKGYGGVQTLDIDIAGILYGTENPGDTDSIPFSGAKGLSKVVAALPGASECLIEKGFRFISGMPLNEKGVDAVATEKALTAEQESDFACAADKARAAYTAEGSSAKAAITALVMQDLLRYRKAN